MRTVIPIVMFLLLGLSSAAAEGASGKIAEATFAAGCFWCIEPPFDEVDGVLTTVVGYAGGTVPNPDYKAVSRGVTGHAEVVRVQFDPSRVRYEELLQVFWRNIDPTVKNRQFCDFGTQYRSAIFYHNEEQKFLAEASLKQLVTSGKITKPVYTEIVSAGPFYPAEEYHQNYYRKNPKHYKSYRKGCGRDKRLKEIWGE